MPLASLRPRAAAVSGTQRFDSLTGLRFLAALHVVFLHAHAMYLPGAPDALHQWASRGYLAVSLFFVLSGFVLSHAYTGADGRLRGSRRAFWTARFARIYPMYVASLILAGPFLFVSEFRTGPEAGHSQLWQSLLLVPTMLQAWTPETWMLWNPPAWSLSVEAFFYALFPLCVLALRRLSTSRLIALLLSCILLSMIPATAFSLLRPTLEPAAALEWGAVATYHPLLRLPEFMVGVLLGQLFWRRGRSSSDRSRRFGLCTCAAVLVAFVVVTGLPAFDTGWPAEPFGNGLLVPLFAVLIYGLPISGQSGLGWVLSRRPVVLLGEASYALYLLHSPLLEWFGALLRRMPWIRERLPEPWLFVAYLMLAIGASVLAYMLIERPARQLLRQALDWRWVELRARRTKAPGLVEVSSV